MFSTQDKILRILDGILDVPVKDLDITLKDLGLDSLDCLDFLHQIKDAFDINPQWDAGNFMEIKLYNIVEQVDAIVSRQNV